MPQHDTPLLIQRVHDGTATGEEVNDLLTAYFRGEPLDSLRGLLHANDESARSASWILSELAIDGRELLDEVDFLLSNKDFRIRYDAVEFVTTCLDVVSFKILAHTLALAADPHIAVRHRCAHLLGIGKLTTFTGIVDQVPSILVQNRLKTLEKLVYSDNIREIEALNASPNADDRMWGLIASAHLDDTRPALLLRIAQGNDDERLFDLARGISQIRDRVRSGRLKLNR